MPRVRPIAVISLGFTIAGAGLTAFAFQMTAGHRNYPYMPLVRDWAVIFVVLAGACWLHLRRDIREERRDGDGLHDECRRREAAMALVINSLIDERGGPAVRQRLRSV